MHAFRKQWSRTNIVVAADVTNADRLLAADVWRVIVVVTLSGPGVVLQWKTCDSRFAMFAIVILIDLVARGCTSIGNLGRCGKPMSVSSSSGYPPVPPNLILNLEIVWISCRDIVLPLPLLALRLMPSGHLSLYLHTGHSFTHV